MTENTTKLKNIIENPAQHTNLKDAILQICAIEASNQNLSRLSLSMNILQELYDYCQEQLKSPQSDEISEQLQITSNILEQNLQLEF